MPNTIRRLGQFKEVLLITFLTRFFLFLLTPLLNPNESFLTSWVRWDGPHYIDIAKLGYQTEGIQALWIVFYPLYPFFIKITNIIINDFYLSSIITSVFFSFITSIFLYKLVLLDFNKKTAILAVWYLNIFPTSYFLQASYTESLFLTLTLGAIYLFRKNYYFYAAVFGLLTTATRFNGLFLIGLFFLEILLAKSQTNLYKKLLVIIVTPLGLLFYLSINYFKFNDFFHFTKPLESNWYKSFQLPWIGVENLILSIPPLKDQLFYAYFLEITTLALTGIVTIYFYRKYPSFSLYLALNLLLFTSTSFIMSTPRYILVLFPLYIFFALFQNKIIITFLSSIFITLLYYLSSLYIKGQWAF